MAAFSSLALLGAGMLANRLLSRKKQPDQTDQSLAPGPTNAGTQANGALTPPAPPILDPAAANQQALQAGQRQRKRAAAGGLLTGARVPTSNVMPVAPRYAQKTLLGS